jgi:hypothetical protein
MSAKGALLGAAFLIAGCASTPTFDRYGGGTEAERANALMICKERTNEAFKTRFALGAIPVARMQSEMTEHTDLCMRGQGFQVK